MATTDFYTLVLYLFVHLLKEFYEYLISVFNLSVRGLFNQLNEKNKPNSAYSKHNGRTDYNHKA